MIADKKAIEWLLENRTQYFIHQHTSVDQATLSRIKNGTSSIENLRLKVASKLTELALAEQKEELNND